MMRWRAGMTETPTLNRSATSRYVGVADWWGFHVWIEDDGAQQTEPDAVKLGFGPNFGCQRGKIAR